MFKKEFWDDRVKKYGHTGHSDPFLYAFDQEARKFAIEKILSRLIPGHRDKALDYGCGTGDFIPVLKQKFPYVIGYDFSDLVLEIAKQKHSEKAGFTSDKKTLRDSGLFDCILTVTVLQGFSESEMRDNLKELNYLLSSDGYLVAMEFFVTELWNKTNNENRLTVNTWKDLLEEQGLTIASQHSFYNPHLVPTASWKAYKNDLRLKLLRLLFRNSGFAKQIFEKEAKKHINKANDVLGVENNDFIIYIIQKRTYADQA